MKNVSIYVCESLFAFFFFLNIIWLCRLKLIIADMY